MTIDSPLALLLWGLSAGVSLLFVLVPIYLVVGALMTQHAKHQAMLHRVASEVRDRT